MTYYLGLKKMRKILLQLHSSYKYQLFRYKGFYGGREMQNFLESKNNN